MYMRSNSNGITSKLKAKQTQNNALTESVCYRNPKFWSLQRTTSPSGAHFPRQVRLCTSFQGKFGPNLFVNPERSVRLVDQWAPFANRGTRTPIRQVHHPIPRDRNAWRQVFEGYGRSVSHMHCNAHTCCCPNQIPVAKRVSVAIVTNGHTIMKLDSAKCGRLNVFHSKHRITDMWHCVNARSITTPTRRRSDRSTDRQNKKASVKQCIYLYMHKSVDRSEIIGVISNRSTSIDSI